MSQINVAVLLSAKKDFDNQSENVEEEHKHHFLFLVGFFLEFYYKTTTNDFESFDSISGIIDPPVLIFIFRSIQVLKDEKARLFNFRNFLSCTLLWQVSDTRFSF